MIIFEIQYISFENALDNFLVDEDNDNDDALSAY